MKYFYFIILIVEITISIYAQNKGLKKEALQKKPILKTTVKKNISIDSTEIMDLFFKTGNELLIKSDTLGAISQFNKSIETNPKSMSALKIRGVLNSTLGKYDDAIDDFTRCLDYTSSDAEIYYQRGLAKHKKQGDPGEMKLRRFGGVKDAEWHPIDESEIWNDIIEDYSHAIEINPNIISAYLKRAEIRISYGNPLEDYDAVLKLQPKNLKVLNLRADWKYYNKDYQGAEEDYLKVLVNNQTDSQILMQVISTKIFTSKYSEAMEYINQFLSLKPNDGLGYNARGICKYVLKDYLGSVNDFDIAISLTPSFADAICNRAKAKYQLKDFENAEKDFSKAAELGSNESKSIIFRSEYDYKNIIASKKFTIYQKYLYENPFSNHRDEIVQLSESFTKIEFDSDESVSFDELASKYKWDGDKRTTFVKDYMTNKISTDDYSVNGIWSIGNLDFYGGVSLAQYGIKISKGTVLYLPK